MRHPLPAFIIHATRAALDIILPHQCLNCRVLVGSARTVCAACWSVLEFIAPPFCQTCGIPLPHDMGADITCGACLAQPPAYDTARAALTYNDGSRSMILKFKHGDALHLAPAFAEWMQRAGSVLLAETDIITPVPLHWRRLALRRYNQAALLAARLGRATQTTVILDLLERRKATPSQGQRNRAARLQNVKGAFQVKPAHAARVKGQRILLIDDVMTTGATVNECAAALKKSGAAAVNILTIARVV